MAKILIRIFYFFHHNYKNKAETYGSLYIETFLLLNDPTISYHFGLVASVIAFDVNAPFVPDLQNS